MFSADRPQGCDELPMSRNGKTLGPLGPSLCGHELHLYQYVFDLDAVPDRREYKLVNCPRCDFRLRLVSSTPKELLP